MSDFPSSLASLFQQLPRMQERMAKAKDELKNIVVEGSSGGGMVKARVNGSFRLESLYIDPSAFTADDLPMLEDLVVAAINQANEKAKQAVADSFSQAAGGLPLGDLTSILGG